MHHLLTKFKLAIIIVHDTDIMIKCMTMSDQIQHGRILYRTPLHTDCMHNFVSLHACFYNHNFVDCESFD